MTLKEILKNRGSLKVIPSIEIFARLNRIQQRLTLLLVILLHLSCVEHGGQADSKFLDTTSHISEIVRTDTSVTADSTNKVSADPVSPISFKLHTVQTLSTGSDFSLSFVSLTDTYPWVDDPDASIINPKYLNNHDPKTFNKHRLTPSQRKRFLGKVSIKETDSLFIYFLKKNQMLTYSIANLPLIAILSPYISSTDFPVPEYYYMIGLDLETHNVDEMMRFTQPMLTSIAPANPFNMGKVERITFNSINENELPFNDTATHNYSYNRCYIYENKDHKYYFHDLGASYATSRRVVVYEKKNDIKTFDRWYMEGEGTEIVPIFTEGSRDTSWIWTGKVLKGHPSVLMGMQINSFGCPRVELLDLHQPPIYIRCDNRH